MKKEPKNFWFLGRPGEGYGTWPASRALWGGIEAGSDVEFFSGGAGGGGGETAGHEGFEEFVRHVGTVQADFELAGDGVEQGGERGFGFGIVLQFGFDEDFGLGAELGAVGKRLGGVIDDAAKGFAPGID